MTGAFVNLYGQSPAYVDWEWDVLKLGFAAPIGNSVDQGTGVSFDTELRYNVQDDLSIGLGFQGAGFSDDFDDNTSVGLSASFIVTADHYLKTDSGTRPFVGLGVGNFRSGSVTIVNGTSSDVIDGVSSIGLTPRIGYELGHGRIMAQYNHTFRKENTNYISVTLALTLWGGYKG